MANSRFEIKQEGLQMIYNSAPEIKGLENTLYLYKGNTLTLDKALNGISATDDLDGNINNITVKYNNSPLTRTVNTNQIGDIKLTYEVTDSWGRTTSTKRTLSIISKSVSNDIEFYDIVGNNKLFSLKYNPILNEFNVDINKQASEGTRENTRNYKNATLNTNTEQQPEKDVVFRLSVFDTNNQEIGKFELSEEEVSNIDSFSKLRNISIYDDYYFSVWSKNPSRIKIQGDIDGDNTLGEDEKQSENYSDGISNNDHMNNVRFKLRTEGLQAVYNKAPKIILKSKNRLTAYAGDPIDYTSGVIVEDDHDKTIPNENIIVDKVKDNTESNLVIGINTVNLSVTDSWGRTSNINRELIIENGIDKNTIKITKEEGEGQPKVLTIGFDHISKKLVIDAYDENFSNEKTPYRYFSMQIRNRSGNVVVPGEMYLSQDKPSNKKDYLNKLSSYTFEYGDIIEVFHHHPKKFNIDGTVVDAREDYTDGVQNPENLTNTKFEITKSGLKAIYNNVDETHTTDNNNIVAPVAPENIPFKLKIIPSERKIKLISTNETRILSKAGKDTIVYKIVLFGQDGNIKKEQHYLGHDRGYDKKISDFWKDVSFDYGDLLYLWHLEPNRSIIKGNIKNQREDYSNGVDDPDNMNNVVFKLTQQGLESVYNEAPKINGVEDIDVYQGQEFDVNSGVTYSDDYDTDHLTKTVTINNNTRNSNTTLDTSTLGEKIVTYTATDRWGKTTTVERKVTVRPNLYKNVFKVYPDTNSISDTKVNIDTRKVAFEIGFDSVTNKYRVFNQSSDILSKTNLEDIAFGIEIKNSNGEEKKSITLVGSDRGNSPELNKLNEVSYSEGDIIRVYRSNLDAISISGDVTGHIPSNDDMTNDSNKFDYMKNTGFKVSNDGLEAIYNHAPILNGITTNKTITKGTSLNLLQGVNVSDDIDNTSISNNDITIRINEQELSKEQKNNYTFANIGTYKIEYILHDSWGRSTLQEVTITVESKVKENSIEVYDSNQNRAFKVIFDTTQNKFVLTNEDTSTTYNSSSNNEDKYFEMIVRDIKGEEKYKVTLNGDSNHDREELKKIHEKEFSKYDTISLYGKTNNAVKIKGTVISSNRIKTNHDYSNGFGTTEKYSQVRFKITDDGLKEMTKKDPTISGLDPKTIKRGEEINFLEGVVVDVQDQNNQDYKISVNSDSFDKLTEGTYTVTYTVTNSWGSSVKQTRKITVEPRTELEKVKFKLKNTNREVILTIGFDSIEKKLRVLNYKLNSTIDSNNSDLAFAINIYDSLGNTLSTLELNGNQQINDDIVNKIKNLDYIEGYRLNVWAKNPQQYLELEGNVNISNPETRKILISTDHIDKMENGRFEVLESGLTYIYNQAPTINGGDETISYYKGTMLSVPNDITVSDDHDNISKNQVVIDDDNVDYDGLGLFDITYIVEDTWGRVGTKKGKINIKSSMDSNVISIYPKSNTTTTRNGDPNSTDNSAFDIKFVRDETLKKNKIQIEKKNSIAEFNPSNPEDTFMNIKIYGANGKEKKSVNLLGNDTVNSKKLTELDELNNFEYDRGDYIAIEGVTNDTKSCVKIQGTVVNQREKYTDGVENLDNIQNVRFKFTDFGLESVYNQAPEITIDETISLDAIKGDDIPYMRGVKLKDDHDKLTKSNVEVTFNPNVQTTKNTTGTDEEHYNDVIKGVAKVGENILEYKVTDSWGRSVTKTRNINLSNGILDNIVTFKARDFTAFLNMKFKENLNSDGIVMTIDNLHYDGIIAQGGNYNYYTVTITKPGNNPITKSIWSENTYTNQFDGFNNMDLPYGTIIKLSGQHPDRLIIDGPVRNQREDYSDGVQNPENYSYVKFEVTDEGLKSIYEESDDLTGDKNIISVMSKESIPLKLKIDPVTKKISVFSSNHITFYYELGPNIPVVGFTLKDQNGNIKFNINGHSQQRGYNFGDAFKKLPNAQSDGSQLYNIGDTLTIWHKTPSRISIKGNVSGAREDYSNGVDNSKNLEEAVFNLTETGLEAVYKEAPKILGLKDTKILKGDLFDRQDVEALITDLRATDSIDGEYENKVIVGETSQLNAVQPAGTIVIDPTSVNTNKVGMYEVKYTVTNSNDRTTRKSSTVVVYDKPTINEANTRIELNSVDNSDEAIKERLKEAVSVTDDDDTLYKKETKLEVLSHNVNPNVENTYTAKYRATDMYGEVTEKDVNISVTRTINVSVPTTIPFQVVTNLTNENADEFISGVMKVQNNNTSDVNVFINSFTRQESTITKNKNYEKLQIVDPNSFEDWNNISKEDSMTKMALGIYNKNGLVVESGLQLTEQNPLWLKEDMSSVKLGVLNRATDLNTPYTSKLSFTSKHGKNFKGGTSRGKFNLVFRFE